MKTSRIFVVLSLVLLAAASAPGLTISNFTQADLSKAAASAMGMELKAAAHDADEIEVTLEFKTEAEPNKAGPIELTVRDGEKLRFQGLLLTRDSQKPGCALVSFTIHRSLLTKASLGFYKAEDLAKGAVPAPAMIHYVLKLDEHVSADLLPKAEGAAKQPAAPAGAAEHRKFPTLELFINNHKYGDGNGCTQTLLTDASASCGHPGHVSEVSWIYLRSSPQGDVYAITRKYPADSNAQKTETKEITYAGEPLVLWSDDFQKIILRPTAPLTKQNR